MRTHHRLKVELTLLGPILTRGSGGEPGIDAPMARNAKGQFMLPFSLIKGKVLDALRDLPDNWLTKNQKGWLGVESGDKAGNWEPERGRLRFGDFVTTQNGTTADPVIERIQIDHTTGATAGRMLMMTEAPFGYGEPVTFTGHVEFIADASEAAAICDTVSEAMRWVPAYGALRTVGFGRTKDVTVTLGAATPTAKGKPAGDQVPVRLTFDRPLCLVGKKHSRNHFESLECVPGSVLKGATARLLLELAGSGQREVGGSPPAGYAFSLVWKHLADIRFAEARPTKKGAVTRPVVPPLSVVCVKGEWHDVALDPGPRLIGGHAPAFAPDWKWEQEQTVRTAFGWADVPKEVRTRTAIDAVTGRAKDENLFSYGLVVPDKPGQEVVWETQIGLTKVSASERQAVRDELAKLFSHGLPNVGKTRAVAAVEWLSKSTPAAQPAKITNTGVHVVTLQTDFLMTDPKLLSPGSDLKAVYQAFWDDVAPGQFRLERFFARQSLHGGYLRKRFGQKGSYEPYLITDRGSTFVLTAVGPDGVNKLAEWIAGGLPLAKWAEVRYGASGEPLWKTCPFVPENGFGEVVVDLACHTEEDRP